MGPETDVHPHSEHPRTSLLHLALPLPKAAPLGQGCVSPINLEAPCPLAPVSPALRALCAGSLGWAGSSRSWWGGLLFSEYMLITHCRGRGRGRVRVGP